jgi:putative hydrolase of the HAD superfamily
MKSNIKAILFDIDDTLFDRNKAQVMILDNIIKRFPQAFQFMEKKRVLEAFLESDRVSTEAFAAGAPSEGLRDLRSRHFLRLLDITEEYAGAITEIYVREYPFVNALVDGAVSLVKASSRRFKVGVVSNGLPDVQYQKLKTIGLRDIFACIVLSEEIGIRKPDPGIFRRAADLLQLPPSQCLYIGNSYTDDIIGAKAAGMSTCWFCRDASYPENALVHTDYVIEHLEEFHRIIKEL